MRTKERPGRKSTIFFSSSLLVQNGVGEKPTTNTGNMFLSSWNRTSSAALLTVFVFWSTATQICRCSLPVSGGHRCAAVLFLVQRQLPRRSARCSTAAVLVTEARRNAAGNLIQSRRRSTRRACFPRRSSRSAPPIRLAWSAVGPRCAVRSRVPRMYAPHRLRAWRAGAPE